MTRPALSSILPGHALVTATSPTFVETEAVVEALARVSDGAGPPAPLIVVFSGPTGTGKTVAACRYVLHLIEGLQPDVMFVRASALSRISRLSDEWRLIVGEEIEDGDDWRSLAFLILDDVGTENLNDAFKSALDEIVDVFYQTPDYERTLVITTNCTLDEFEERYGVRVLDRIRERGQWIPCLVRMRGATTTEEVARAAH